MSEFNDVGRFFMCERFMRVWQTFLLMGVLISILCGCANNQPKENINDDGSPGIDHIADIGSLPIDKEINKKERSDGKYTPGEYIFITGRNLKNSKIFIDNKTVQIEQVLNKGIVIRVPRGLSPSLKHKLKVSNEKGVASEYFYSTHYLISTDTDGNNVGFMRTRHDVKGLVEKERIEIEHDRVLFNVISNNGGFAYSLGTASKVDYSGRQGLKYGIGVKTIHLAAPNEPKEVTQQIFPLYSAPTSVSLSSNNQLIILGKRDISIIDAKNPLKLKFINNFKLPDHGKETTFVDVVFLDDGKTVVVLDAQYNVISLIDISNPLSPEVMSEENLFPGIELPMVVDLESDPHNDKKFWVLCGPNFRVASQKAKELYDRIFHNKEKKQKVDIAEQLISISIENGVMSIGSVHKLPEKFAPFFAVFGEDDNIYVSGIKMDILNMDEVGNINKWIKSLGKMLWNSVAIGRVLKINPNTGKYKSTSKGFGIYYHLVYCKDIGPAFTLLKLKGTLFPPFVKMSWGVGVKSQGTYAVRSLDKHALFPPYSLGHISFQK
ncbi:MAG: hypothetical protein D6B27_08415 [Gammaproteobacteria bacterium]|nr:MAG: hypothetical protein D6B27_08415 [Gammaproteobacteria bacterium]